ncbi:sugar isomerase [Lachnospiraceae bacterium WCA-9-b2]|uniref:Sugar isomerase n=1 Tax=Sporofaciens musculi TaxID=2681861 RepID=A0A7X3SHU7_9FIRM|nr:polysaccharide biosynthesis C-terminal domain-containing protein [Sporofaciens musculi]MXP74785.1 sugar isomerase [Sporofaciens musculi]
MFSKVVTLIIGIILPKLYIDSFGSEVNGLLSSISNILIYINLLEAGVGSASTQALYKAIKEKKQDDINGILAATDKFYKRTGIFFFLIVCILAILYPVCVESEISYLLVVVLILLSALPSALRYFFQGKYTILLNADNRAYVLNTLTLVINLATNLSKAVLIILGFNVLAVQIVSAFISVLQMFIILVYIKHRYKKLDLSAKPDELAISKKKYAMVHMVTATIFSHIDVLVLTLFTNLKVVSVYTVYNMIYVQLSQVLKGISNSLNASFGQLYYEDRERFGNMYKLFAVVYRYLTVTVMATAGIMTLPFLKLYTSTFHDINYVDKILPLLFVSAMYLETVRWPEVLGINTTGHFKETALAAVMEMMINLVLSVALAVKFDIYGVLVATTIALLYRTLEMIHFVNKYVIFKKWKKDMIYVLFSWLFSLLMTYFSYVIIGEPQGYLALILLAGEVFVIVSVAQVFLSFLFYRIELLYIVKKVVEITKI